MVIPYKDKVYDNSKVMVNRTNIMKANPIIEQT